MLFFRDLLIAYDPFSLKPDFKSPFKQLFCLSELSKLLGSGDTENYIVIEPANSGLRIVLFVGLAVLLTSLQLFNYIGDEVCVVYNVIVVYNVSVMYNVSVIIM